MVRRLPPSTQHGSDTHDSEMVDSLEHPLAVWLRQLLDAQLGDSTQAASPQRLIIIDDEENIVQALRAHLEVERVFHTGDRPVSTSLREALPPDATTHELAKRTSKKLFETSKLSRTFAVAKAPKAPQLTDFATLKQDIVVLENLGIAGNIGAIIRTAVALGVGGVVLLDADIDVYDRRLIRASRGHVFSLPVVQTTAQALLTFCKQHDRPLLVTNPHASQLVDDIAGLQRQLAIVFGNEKAGCSQALLKAARFQLKIPTVPPVESLNVSTAAAITLFQRVKRNRS